MELEENEVQVLWSQKEMEVEKIKDDWTLVERTLMRGDIVVLGADTNGQMGTVTEVHSFVELGHVYGDDKPIYRCVPAVMLYPSSEWRFELAVARNGWIGSVSRFCWRLRVKLETSETIVTVDTWSMGSLPIPLLRRTSHLLKDQPAEGRFLVGTTVAISTSSLLENLEGDTNWIAPASARTDFPEAMSTIPESERSSYALGLIVSSELSGVIVSWADHAQGDCAGSTRPYAHQSVHDISVVDPYFCNSIGRYELSWATPEIRKDYVDRDHFYFPDGTRLPRSIIADHHDKAVAKTLKATQDAKSQAENGKESTGSSESVESSSQSEAAPGSTDSSNDTSASSSEAQPQDTSFPPIFTPPPAGSITLKPIPSFQQFAEAVPSRPKSVKISDTAITTRYTKHPSPTDSTTTGSYERVMTDYEYSRRLAPLMAPYAVERGALGYVEDDLVYVASVTCFVDVQWQDGRTTRKHLSTDLLPYLILGDTDFQPNDYIQSVPTTVEEAEKSRLAVTQSVDHVNRVATVWWVEEDSIEPHVSIYMLEDADAKYHYRLGYFVLRVLLSHETRFEGTVGLVDNMDDRGRIYVLWVEGTSGWYYPCQLMPFDMADYDLTADEATSNDDLLRGYIQDDQIRYLTRPFISHLEHEDENEWESESLADENTELSREVLYSCNDEDGEASSVRDEYGNEYLDTDSEDEDESAEEEEEQEVDDDENDGDESSDAEEDSDGDIPVVEDDKFDIGESSELYSDLNGKGEMNEDQLLALSIAESLKTFRDEQKKQTGARHDKDDKEGETDDEEDSEASDKESEEDEESSPLAPFRFSDEVPTNHHYRTYSSSASSALPKLALKEWHLLQTATLDGAYVIAYEDRVDLFRFLILGAHGTPFYLSWFMFDVHLDSNHPAHPPRVHFHSLGPKLHPNLYEDGNVCLSLLGTWNGEGVEVWDPQASNILQVVLSIQGLILGVKEPYYLEAGYDRHRGTPEGTANSLVYNERSFLLSVQQMKKLIERPPPEFCELILDSFRKNRHIILALESALSQDPEVLANVDMTMFGLPKGPPSLGFVSAFKSIFPSVKKVLESI